MKNITYINAGAGSGKTYTLTRILAEKLAEKDVNGKSIINPSQVILTTFTELAAAEFREKARQQLLSGIASKGIESNLEAATQISSAAIGTVHSIALMFIKKFWYLLEYGADIQTITERDADFYMSQSLARIVNNPDYEKDMENFRKFQEYYDICNSFGQPDHLFWQDYLNRVVEKMEYYDINDVRKSIEMSTQTLKEVFKEKELDESLIQNALKEYQNFCSSNVKKAEDKADRHAKSALKLIGQPHDKEWMDGVKELFFDLCKEKNALKNCNSLEGAIESLKMAEASASQLTVLIPFITSVFHVAKAWRDDYIAYKECNHIISYNDMERLFLRLLDTEIEVQDYIRENYRLIMVDEFQDSNPLQLKIFNRLSELIAPEGQSYWVGDPKQAIYGFRGADTELVNSVSRHFTFYDDAEFHPGTDANNLGSGRLTESWRSRDTLVYLVNDCFKKAFEEEDKMDPLCITLNPHFKDETCEVDALVHWDILENNKEKAAEAIAWKVKELIESGKRVRNGKRDEPLTPITPRSIAILNRTNDSCKSIIKALRKQGVPVCESEDNIMQRMEVQLVVTLLQFVQNPSAKYTIANLMRLLWEENTESILSSRIQYIQTIGQETKDEWMMDDIRVKELRKIGLRLESLSIPEIVEALIYECNIPSLMKRWGDIYIRKQNLSTLQQLAKDYDQICLQMGLGASINGFIYYLNMMEPKKEKDNLSDTVKVFTYHGSKGLEWPIVILNELDKDSLEDKEFSKKQFTMVQEVIFEDKTTQENPFDKTYYLHLFPATFKKYLPNIVLEHIKELPLYQEMKRRAKGEERRLLYVGMTRAKDSLYSIGYKDGNAWLKNAGIENVSNDNFWGNDIYKPLTIEISAPDDQEEKKDDLVYSILQKPVNHTERQKQNLSPSTLKEYAGYNAHRLLSKCDHSIPTQGWHKADYATIGTCIHDFFAVFMNGDKEGNRCKLSSVISGYGLMDILGKHTDVIIASAEQLYAQLNAHYPLHRLEREFPFSIHLPTGQTLRGEIDLLWFYTDSEGEHCILIDYKSYAGYDMDEHTKGYYAQLSAYADALKKSGIDITHSIVYYPVHGVLHELVIQ